MGRPLRVLIVEDSPRDAESIVRELQRGGFDASWVRVDTPDALTRTLRQQSWDLVVADYSLPQFSGTLPLKVSQDNGHDLPVIAVSKTRERAAAARRAGAGTHLPKSHLKHLPAAVKRALRDAQDRRAQPPAAEEALRASEARIRGIVDAAVDGIITIDERGSIESFNPAAERIFGYRSEEVIGRNINMLMPAPYASTHEDYVAKYLQTGEKKIIGIGREVTGRRKDGTTFPMDLAVSEVRLRNRRLFTGLVRDITSRKATEEALRRQRDFAESLIETAQAIVLVLDTSGRIVRFNRYMEDISGYRLEEVQGKDWFATFLPEAERSRIQAVFSRAVRGARIHANINPIVTKDGTERLIEWHAKTLKDAEGTVVGVLSVGHDITERKRAEQRLFTQHAVTQILARSASLQDAIPQLLQAICEGVGWELGELWRLDCEAKLLRWDGGWHVPALNGSTFQAVSRETPFAFAEGLPGRVWASGTPVWVTDVATDAAFLRGAIAAKLGLHGAFAFPVRKGDDLIGVMAFFGPTAGPPDHELLRMFDALGRQIGDFIERKRVEEEMMRLVAIVESSDDAIIGRTVDGSIVSWNRGAEKTYGYSAAEAIGRPVSMLLPPDRPHEMNQILERIRSGQRITHYETVRLRKDGTRVPVALTVSPMNDGEGKLIGTSSIARDITERKRAEAERHELQKLAQQRERLADIGAITAQIVHDVGNPLAGISMQAQLVLRRAQRDGRQPLSAVVRPLERILAEVSRLDALVKEFTEFSHEQRLDVKTIDLRRFLYGVVELWQPVAAARQITLSVEGRPADLAVRADGEKLRRVLDNLVKNAIEAIDRGPGSVKIAVSQVSPDTVRIAVADSGPGIPDTVQVFRLFETTKTNGSGIGLAVARQIVLAHRGKIECARLDPHGTVFRIELPCGGPVG